MNKNDEILEKLMYMESVINEIHKEIVNIRNENEERFLEQFQIMSRIENIADFIKTRYNVVIEEKEKFMSETMENNHLL